MQTSEVLNKAADLIEERGWYQGGYSPDGGWDGASALCTLGAINCAAGGLEIKAASRLYMYLGQSVLQWNDHPGQTAEEVVEVLRATALIEAAKENAETRQAVSA